MPQVPATIPTGRGRKPYRPTQRERERVTRLALMGLSIDEIAQRMGLHRVTFARHFREQYADAVEERNGNVVETLYTAAESAVQDVPDRLPDGTEVGTKRIIQQPGVTAAIYLTKARMGWKEKSEIDLNHRFARRLAPEDEDI